MVKKPRLLNGQQFTSGQPLYAELTNIQDMVQGIGATISGQPYKVYRIQRTTSGDPIQPSSMISDCFPCWRELLAGKKHMEGFESAKAMEIYWFMLGADFRCSIVGDVFLLNDPLFGPGRTQVAYNSAQAETGMPTNQINGFALAIHPVLRIPIGGRLDRFIQIFRPATTTASGYLDTTLHAANPLILANGSFSLGDNNQVASNIPAGFMAVKRDKGFQLPDVPEVGMKTRFSCYTPPLPGFTPVEGDIVVDSYSGQYRIINCWNQQVGLVGNQFVLERQVSQVGFPF
jgi:hypothetical protein